MTRIPAGPDGPLHRYRTLAGIVLLWFTGMSVALGATPTCTLVRTSELAVTVSPGAVPLVAGTVNGVPAQFMLDSGAFFSVLWSTTLEKFHLQPERGRDFTMVWVGGREQAHVTRVQDFGLAGLGGGGLFHNVDFVVSGANMSGTDGLLGENVLGVWDVEYDLANGIVRIFHPMNCRKQDGRAYWRGSSEVAVLDTESRSPLSPHIRSTATLDGTKLRVLFDTGAARSLLTLRAAVKAGFKPARTEEASQTFGATGLRSLRTQIGVFKALELGGEVIRNVRIQVGEPQERDGNFDLLLGADFFLAHRVYVAKSQRRLYFTYNGGPVFDLQSHDRGNSAASAPPAPAPPAQAATSPESAPTPAPDSPAPVARSDAAPPPTGSDAPTDAKGFRLRAAASAARGERASAYRDFDRAIELDPTDADTFYQRAVLHVASRETQLALNDLDRAIQLRPIYVQALVLRGKLRLSGDTKDPAAAVRDFDAAVNAAPTDAYLLLQLAAFLETHHLPNEALAHFDQWVAANPHNPRMPSVLNSRCWIRATEGKQLDLALQDCNKALHALTDAHILNSRGLVYLRMGELDKAIADYRHALRLNARDASSLYGLGLAQQQKKLTRDAERNLKAAVALRASIAQEYQSMGLTAGSSAASR